MASTSSDDGHEARVDAARRKITDCDSRLAKYRAALDAGADPIIVAGWMAEVKGERLAAEEVLGASAAAAQPLTRSQVRALVKSLRDVLSTLSDADPALKAELYAELGVRVTYDPVTDRATVVAQPVVACATGRVRGGT